MVKQPSKTDSTVLADQKLIGFFTDKVKDDRIVSIILQFEKNSLVVSWDKEKDTFKFSIG